MKKLIAWEEVHCHICRCQRKNCRHVWFSGLRYPPKVCPKCHNPTWMRSDAELKKPGKKIGEYRKYFRTFPLMTKDDAMKIWEWCVGGAGWRMITKRAKIEWKDWPEWKVSANPLNDGRDLCVDAMALVDEGYRADFLRAGRPKKIKENSDETKG